MKITNKLRTTNWDDIKIGDFFINAYGNLFRKVNEYQYARISASSAPDDFLLIGKKKPFKKVDFANDPHNYYTVVEIEEIIFK